VHLRRLYEFPAIVTPVGRIVQGKCVEAVPGETRPPSAPALDVWRQGVLARHGCVPV